MAMEKPQTNTYTIWPTPELVQEWGYTHFTNLPMSSAADRIVLALKHRYGNDNVIVSSPVLPIDFPEDPKHYFGVFIKEQDSSSEQTEGITQ